MKDFDYFYIFAMLIILFIFLTAENADLLKKIDTLIAQTTVCDPNTLAAKNKEINHWRNMCSTLEKRNYEIAEKCGE